MRRENSLISIIIPSFNRKELINKAIESVLKQNYKCIEIIIIDDGSTDGTYQYLKEKYKKNKSIYIYTNEKNMGAGNSRKIGYNKANGKYVIFMDDDDYYTNFDFFKQAIQILEEKTNIGMVCASSIIEYVSENKFEASILNIKGEIKKEEYLQEFQQRYMKSNSTFTTVFRKETLDKANFDDVKMVNDSSIYLRALLENDAYILDLICGIYRIHSKNITFNLNTDFIIENLNEKKKIYEEIKKRKLLKDTNEWLKKQIKLTATYFVKYNKICNEDFERLIKWCEVNCEDCGEDLVNSLLSVRGGKII